MGNPKEKITHSTKYCNLLEKSKNTVVSCVYQPNRLECLRSISMRESDFSVFHPEDLYFSTLLKENSVLVAGEIRGIKENPYHHENVVVVRKDSNITSIKDLMGKKLCHPGTENGPEWSYIFSQVSSVFVIKN